MQKKILKILHALISLVPYGLFVDNGSGDPLMVTIHLCHLVFSRFVYRSKPYCRKIVVCHPTLLGGLFGVSIAGPIWFKP